MSNSTFAVDGRLITTAQTDAAVGQIEDCARI